MDKAHFEWKEEYSVNVGEIDEQHKELIRIIDNLYQSIMETTGTDITSSIFNKLNEYTQYHFDTEEKYFNDFGYENTKDHIAQHSKFKADIFKMEKSAESKELDIFELFFYLENWWINHILDADKKYSKFFNEHGLN